MANIFELNINLNTIEQSEAEKALNDTTNGAATDTTDGDPKEEGKLKTALKVVGSTYAIKEAYDNVAKPILNFQINKYGLIYGDQARQNQINNLSESVDMVMNIAGSAASGFSAGVAIGGAAGGPWGLALAVALEVTSTVITGIQNLKVYNERQLDYKYNSNYTQERLGILTASKGR